MNGQIVILNGAPRSGKSSIVRVIQETFDGPWMNLGVDVYVRGVTPQRYRPGIGLRPGSERPDLEPLIPTFYLALYDSIAAHSRLGLNVVTDIGHHDSYTQPRSILTHCARRLEGLPVLFVGVRCSLEEIMERRNRGETRGEAGYLRGSADDPVPAPVVAWQREVHLPGVYDVEVDTSESTPEDCAKLIQRRLGSAAAADAFHRLALLATNSPTSP